MSRPVQAQVTALAVICCAALESKAACAMQVTGNVRHTRPTLRHYLASSIDPPDTSYDPVTCVVSVWASIATHLLECSGGSDPCKHGQQLSVCADVHVSTKARAEPKGPVHGAIWVSEQTVQWEIQDPCKLLQGHSTRHTRMSACVWVNQGCRIAGNSPERAVP